MIYQLGQTDKDDSTPGIKSKWTIKEPSHGILNDFDMAVILNEDGQITSDPLSQQHVTGTLLFMACDLLQSQEIRAFQQRTVPAIPKGHLYRHDLESFFYILIWAASCCDLSTGAQLPLPSQSPLRSWSDGNWDAFAAKICFYHGCLRNYELGIRPEWQDLWDEQIEPLFAMFLVGLNAQEEAQIDKKTNFDYATCGGRITFEKFMLAIGQTPPGENPIT